MKRILYVFLFALLTTACKFDLPGSNTSNDPGVASFTPAEVSRGERNVEGVLIGSDLDGITSVDLGSDIIVKSFSVVSSSEIRLIFSVSVNARPGPRGIALGVPGGLFALFLGGPRVLTNHAPIAVFSVDPAVGSLQTTFMFDGMSSRDLDGDDLGFQWDFGDGAILSGKRVVTHKFQKVGEYNVELRVKDSNGTYGYAKRKVDVQSSVRH